jgi:hypothetical protein
VGATAEEAADGQRQYIHNLFAGDMRNRKSLQSARGARGVLQHPLFE